MVSRFVSVVSVLLAAVLAGWATVDQMSAESADTQTALARANGSEATEPIYQIEIIEFQPREGMEPQILFRAKTVEQFPCSNYNIETDFEISDGTLSVSLGEAQEPPDACLTMIGPAVAAFFPEISGGTYQLLIDSAAGQDSYSLMITGDKIELTPVHASFTQPVTSLFYRFPVNSFAYYCGTLIQDKNLCDSFGNILETELRLQPISFPEGGTWPYAPISQGHYYDMPARFYSYGDEFAWLKAGQLLEQFTLSELEGKCGVGISLSHWSNEHFRSWLIAEPSTDCPPPAPPSELPPTGSSPPGPHGRFPPAFANVLVGAAAAISGLTLWACVLRIHRRRDISDGSRP